ncbi:MAG TPA: tryptophan synthase subunit alpha [Thermodesulfovibrionales bacterium]|jgi:tryptophan synthase alpha chain|nr:tryptophan synthase subunit alpha [Thermodesulfovibrionales bacterium]
MNRIEKTFRSLKEQSRKAFIPYIMAGDPSLGKTRETVLMLERCGADIVELGVPFTDPIADGPTIQRAAERALQEGVTLTKVIGLVSDLRKESRIPIALMTYYNPVFKYGDERFVRDAREAGIDGVIIPDLPPDEAHELMKIAKRSGLATIFLLAPTSTDERITKVTKASTGFVYYVSMTGITGSRLAFDESLKESIGKIRAATDRPVAIGFGVSTPDEAKAVSGYADGVIVGSAIVKRLHESPEGAEGFILELRKAIP